MKRILGILVAASLILGFGMPVPAQASSTKLRQAILNLRNRVNAGKSGGLPNVAPVAAPVPKPVVTPVAAPAPKPAVTKPYNLAAALQGLSVKIKAIQATAAANRAVRDAQTEQKLKNVLPQDRASIGGHLGY